MKLPVCSYFLIIILGIVECYVKKRKTGSVDYENEFSVGILANYGVVQSVDLEV